MNSKNSLPCECDTLAHGLRIALSDTSALAHRQSSRMQFSPTISYGRHFSPPQPTAKQAAVMILLELCDGEWSIPLTERPQHLPDHPGQISLPGGRVEGDELPLDAAIREFNEELGTVEFPGEVVGELSPLYVYNSDYYVRPFLAVGAGPIQYFPCQHEVARVIRLPMNHLLQVGHSVEQTFHRGAATWTARTIQCEDVAVWGATAIMLGECATLLAAALPLTELD